MGPVNGPFAQRAFRADLESSAENAGSIISTPTLKKGSGHRRRTRQSSEGTFSIPPPGQKSLKTSPEELKTL